MDKAIKSLYNNMKKGGVIYATLCAVLTIIKVRQIC